MRVLVFLAATMLAASQSYASPRTIGFADLPDPAALNYEDPFRAMGLKMLEELRTVVRLKQRLAREDIEAETRLRLEHRLAEARDELQANGHNIEALLAQRWVVAKNRKQAVIATNPELSGAEVTIVGYLIPAGTRGMGKSISYLVPEVGMCSHMPPPPPNQLVRVELAAPSPVKSPYVAVQVSGQLHPRPSDEAIHILDGEVRMVSMWQLKATETIAAGVPSNSPTMTSWKDHPLRPRHGTATDQVIK